MAKAKDPSPTAPLPARLRWTPRRHYAFAVAPAKKGWRVSHVIEMKSRGEADKYSLTLHARHGDAEAISLERELAEGEILAGELIGRPKVPAASPARRR